VKAVKRQALIRIYESMVYKYDQKFLLINIIITIRLINIILITRWGDSISREFSSL
jgi:hypothetical protein